MPSTRDHLIRQARLQDALLKLQAEKSLRRYIEQAWPILEPSVPFLPNWHIDYLVEHLEAVTAGQITRLLITIPPRCMKSLLVSVLWPTWEWIHHPTRRWIFASYAEALAHKHSMDRRTVLRSALYQGRWGDRVTLASDQNEKREFHNMRRGTMVATSIGGSILGKGAVASWWTTRTIRCKPKATCSERPRLPSLIGPWPRAWTTRRRTRSWS